MRPWRLLVAGVPDERRFVASGGDDARDRMPSVPSLLRPYLGSHHCLAERLSAADVEPSKYGSWTRIELFGKRVTGNSLPGTGGHHAPTKSKY